MEEADQIDFSGVPVDIARAFRQGLDDVNHDRVVSVESAIAEGRRRFAEYRRANAKRTHGQAIQQRS